MVVMAQRLKLRPQCRDLCRLRGGKRLQLRDPRLRAPELGSSAREHHDGRGLDRPLRG